MAFSVYVSSNNNTTTSLSDGAPFKFDGLEGISSAPIVRFEQRGPVQQGATDLGYQLGPRVLQLSLLFHASTPALLDTYRQQLMDAFKPLTETPIYLYCRRDDNVTRRLIVHTVDDIAISLVPEHYPGHLHRATLRLRAAKPLWRNESVSIAASTLTTDWWLAGGYIDSANVMEHVENPTQGQAWTYTGTITESWSVAFRTSPDTLAVSRPAVFHAGTGNLTTTTTSNELDAAFFYYQPESDFRWGLYAGNNSFGNTMPAGTHNYVGASDGTNLYAFYDGTVGYLPFGGTSIAANIDISGTARRWRSDRTGNTATHGWTPAVPKAAVYNVVLSQTQRIALDASMGTSLYATINAVNAGDIPAYPIIKLTGPLSNITVTNSSTGDTFSLGTIAIASGDIYTIDLRSGDKKVFDINGVDRLSQVTSPVGLAGFRLEPSPIVAGGTNTITVVGSAIAATSRVTVEHYNEYGSF